MKIMSVEKIRAPLWSIKSRQQQILVGYYMPVQLQASRNNKPVGQS